MEIVIIFFELSCARNPYYYESYFAISKNVDVRKGTWNTLLVITRSSISSLALRGALLSIKRPGFTQPSTLALRPFTTVVDDLTLHIKRRSTDGFVSLFTDSLPSSFLFPEEGGLFIAVLVGWHTRLQGLIVFLFITSVAKSTGTRARVLVITRSIFHLYDQKTFYVRACPSSHSVCLIDSTINHDGPAVTGWARWFCIVPSLKCRHFSVSMRQSSIAQ